MDNQYSLTQQPESNVFKLFDFLTSINSSYSPLTEMAGEETLGKKIGHLPFMGIGLALNFFGGNKKGRTILDKLRRKHDTAIENLGQRAINRNMPIKR